MGQPKVMKYYSSGEDLAKDMGVSLSVIEKAHEDLMRRLRVCLS